MIELFQHKIEGINVYIDEYQDDYKILKGMKQGNPEYTYMIMNRKTAELLYNSFIIKQRKDKILKLKNNLC